MRIRQTILLLALALLLMLTLPVVLIAQENGAKPVDVVLVLDNSGSMKKNDPNRLMVDVVSTFASQLSSNSRLGMVLFAEDVDLALPLIGAEEPNFKERVDAALQRVDYSGRLTDIPAGVERAIYLLRENARPESERVIVFLTDGIVDVGNPAKDVERARWLRESLAQEAKRLSIRVFGVAFTEGADFQLIQSVAQTTEGEYFRVLSASEISGVFDQINSRISQLSRIAAPPPQTSAPVPATTRSIRWARSHWPWLLGGGLLFVGLVAVGVRRAKRVSALPAAKLRDLSGQSNAQIHSLKKPLLKIGRDEKLNDVVLAFDTVSGAHAEVRYRQGSFYVCDLRSSNGTFVNEKKISDPDSNREVVLKHGDRIRFDAYEFEFVLDALENAQKTRFLGAAPETRAKTRLRGEGPPPPVAQSPVAEVVVMEKETTPAKGDAEVRTRLKSEMCPRHQSWQATELCPKCRIAYCDKCMRERDGQRICAVCAETMKS